MAGWLVGIDTGGTFTDLIAFNAETGERRIAKVGSVPDDPSRAVMDALAELFAGGVEPAEVASLVHGTTVATNAILEGRGVKTGLLITRGFRAVYEARGWAQPDPDDLLDDQRKLVWDVLRRTYQARYRLRADDTMREDAFDIRGWRGIDLIVVPPLLAGYAMYHGLDKKVSFAGTQLRLSVEPFSKWREDDVPAGLGIEWGPEGWPVSIIVTAGLDDGNFQSDFVGIGTSIGMVRRALALQEVEDHRER